MRIIVDEMPIVSTDCQYAGWSYDVVKNGVKCFFDQDNVCECRGVSECPHFISMKDYLASKAD